MKSFDGILPLGYSLIKSLPLTNFIFILGKSLLKEIKLLASFKELKLSIEIGYRLFLFKAFRVMYQLTK